MLLYGQMMLEVLIGQMCPELRVRSGKLEVSSFQRERERSKIINKADTSEHRGRGKRQHVSDMIRPHCPLSRVKLCR